MIPIMAPGRRLTIDALTLRTGRIKVEVVGVATFDDALEALRG